MEVKLSPRQNEIISRALAKMASDNGSSRQIKEAKESLVTEFLSLNSQTDFQSIPSEVPPEWLDAS